MIRHMTYSRFIAGAICLTLIALVSIGRAQSPALQPRSDARFVYVSPERGDDANPGLHDAPVKTAERGLSLLRNGYGDWLLLERGYEYRLENRVMLPRGASADTPVVIAAFGSGDTPQLHVGPNRDAFNYQNLLADYITVAPTVQLTGLADPFPILQPGNGWSGPTPQPDPVGKPGDLGYDAKAIARWDVVPYQTFDGDFHIGVVAFHMNGIDRVEFAVDGGPWTPVHEMQLNPRTNVWEYTVTLRASLFKKDGPIEVRAIAWPKTAGEPRVLGGEMDTDDAVKGEHSIFLNANANQTLPARVRYVSPSGSDSHGDGTRTNPYQSIMKAARSIQDEQGDNADGGTIYLMPGEHVLGTYSYSLLTKTEHRWLTVTRDPTAAADDVIITKGATAGLRTRLVRVHNLRIVAQDSPTVFRTPTPLEDYIWIDSCDLTGVSPHIGGFWVNGFTGQFVTDTNVKSCANGFTARLQRNVHINNLGSDAFSNSGCVINSSVANINAGPTGFHPDVFQIYGHPGNIIVYGLTAVEGIYSQGLFAGKNVPVNDVAFINCEVDNRVPGNVGVAFQFAGPTTHMYIRGTTIRGSALWRTDMGFSATNVVIEDSYDINGHLLAPRPRDVPGVRYVQTHDTNP